MAKPKEKKVRVDYGAMTKNELLKLAAECYGILDNYYTSAKTKEAVDRVYSHVSRELLDRFNIDHYDEYIAPRPPREDEYEPAEFDVKGRL